VALHDRINAAFKEGDDDRLANFGDRYLDHVIEAEKAIADGLRRTVVQIALLVTVFVLLAGAQKAQFEFGPLKLTNVAEVLILVPPIISVLYFDFGSLLAASYEYEGVRALVVGRLYPKLRRENLSAILGPLSLQVWGFENWQDIRGLSGYRLSGLLKQVNRIVGVSALLGVAGFFVYAYLHLFHDSKANTVAVLLSLAFSLLNMLRVFLLLAIEAQDGREFRRQMDAATDAGTHDAERGT